MTAANLSGCAHPQPTGRADSQAPPARGVGGHTSCVEKCRQTMTDLYLALQVPLKAVIDQQSMSTPEKPEDCCLGPVMLNRDFLRARDMTRKKTSV